MTIIIKDSQGNVVVEQELNEKDCTIKVLEDKNGQKQYRLEQAAGAYH